MKSTCIYPADEAIKAIDYRLSKNPACQAYIRKTRRKMQSKPWELAITLDGKSILKGQFRSLAAAQDAMKLFSKHNFNDSVWLVTGYPQLDNLDDTQMNAV
jgi:hypothetical protein